MESKQKLRKLMPTQIEFLQLMYELSQAPKEEKEKLLARLFEFRKIFMGENPDQFIENIFSKND